MSVTTEDLGKWETVRSQLKSDIGERGFSSWIAPLSVTSVEEGLVTLVAPSSYVSDRVQMNFGPKIRDIWRSVDPKVRRVIYSVGDASDPLAAPRNHDEVLAGEINGAVRSAAPERFAPSARDERVSASVLRDPDGPFPSEAAAARGKAQTSADDGLDGFQSIPLNDRFRFETYVVGRPNEFAWAAAKRVAEDPNTPFNPLFLYGASGLGKTHLLHAIAWRRRELFPNDRIMFISSETFLMQFVTALRRQNTIAFKEVLRSVDMLIIDDVQHIIGKNYTQEEFFHTFNALAERHRQIVLSADCSPTSLDGLDERLRSRLGWGLVADLHPTDYELRLGILESKTEQAMERTPGLQVDPKVLDFLAHRILSDVRTLEGALNRLFAIATMQNRTATIEMAQRELQDLLRHSDRKVTVEEIQRKVAEHYNIRLGDMHSPRRSRSVARPRQVAMYLCKQLTQKSLPDIGQKFGGRDHTTVMHAVKRITELRQIDSAFDDDVERLRRMLEG